MVMRSIALALLAVLLAAGCSKTITGKKIDYESTRKLAPLEIPPDLSSLPPDTTTSTSAGSKQGATYSKFEREQKRQAGGPQNAKLLPEYEKIKLVRAGAQRWLVVETPADQLWPQILDFVDKMGLSVAKEQPQAGIVETNWAENRANAGTTIQKFLSKLTGQGYGTGQMDKYRIRLERGQHEGTTEIYLTHRGLVQVVDESASGADLTGREVGGPLKWQPRPPDPELEAEMMRLLMVHLGTTQQEAEVVLKEKTPARASLERGAGQQPELKLTGDLDDAWRRVGISLDNLGYYVESEDRSNWVYFVRDVNEDGKKKKKKKKQKDDEKNRFQVALKETGEGIAVQITDANGKPVRPKETEQILSLLYEQLK
jgi:outer membrane protein assembly factor BamC